MNDKESSSLLELLKDIPRILRELLQAEINRIKESAKQKAKYAGIGVGLFALAGAIAFFALGVLITLIILALSLAVSPWLATLIVFLALLLAALGCIFAALSMFKKISPPTEDALDIIDLEDSK